MQVCMIGLSNKARTGSLSGSSIHNLDDFTVIFFSRRAFKITQKSGKISILTFSKRRTEKDSGYFHSSLFAFVLTKTQVI